MAIDLGPLQRACRDTWGDSVTYTPVATGTPATITGVFEMQTYVAEGGTPVLSSVPVLGVVLADLAAAPRIGDGVVVNAVSYKVADVQNDGQGMAALTLQRAS